MKKLNRSIQNLGLLFFVLTSAVSCSSQDKVKLSLGDIFKKCEVNTSIECKQVFFENFPKSFLQFQELYGYDDAKGKAPYYDSAEKHLNFFFKTSEVVKNDDFINKLIDISRDGKWDADFVNSFQEKLRSYFFIKYDLFIKLLKKRNETEVKGFWYFFSDEPHFNSEISTKVLKLLEKEIEMKKNYLYIIKKVKEDNVH